MVLAGLRYRKNSSTRRHWEGVLGQVRSGLYPANSWQSGTGNEEWENRIFNRWVVDSFCAIQGALFMKPIIGVGGMNC